MSVKQDIPIEPTVVRINWFNGHPIVYQPFLDDDGSYPNDLGAGASSVGFAVLSHGKCVTSLQSGSEESVTCPCGRVIWDCR